MMLKQEEFSAALRKKISAAGSQSALAEKLGMTQSRISDYLRGRFQVHDITIGTLHKLFPEMEIDLHSCEHSNEGMAEKMEEMLLKIYRSLPEDQQIKCFAMLLSNFGKKKGD